MPFVYGIVDFFLSVSSFDLLPEVYSSAAPAPEKLRFLAPEMDVPGLNTISHHQRPKSSS